MNKQTLVAIFITGLLVYAASSRPSRFDKVAVKGNPSFLMSNNLSCTVLYSTDAKTVGKKVSLLDLKNDHPRVLFESGVDSPMQKLFETEDLLAIQLVASGSGSVDTFHLDKKRGVFTEVSSGIGPSAEGLGFSPEYAVASKGNCK